MSKKLALSVIVKEATPQKIRFQCSDKFRSIRQFVFLLFSLVLVFTIAFVQANRTEIYDGIVILFVVPSLIIAFILLRPSDHRVEIDFDQNTLTHETEYRFSLPVISKVDTQIYPLSSFTKIEKEKNAYTDSYALVLEAPEVLRLRLAFAQGKVIAQRIYRLLGLEQGPIEVAVRELPVEEDLEDVELEWDPLAAEVAGMHNQLAGLARSLFFLGIMHFIASGVLDFTWGFILILVAIGSLMFEHPAMFVVHAFTLGYVGFSNIFAAGFGFWAFLGVYQLYLAYRTYKQFRQYEDVQTRYFEEAEPGPADLEPFERTKRWFPWLSVIFSSVGLSTYCVVISVGLILAIANNAEVPLSDTLISVFSVQFSLGLLGLASGAAAVLSGFPRKVLSWLGLVLGVMWFILYLFQRFTL